MNPPWARPCSATESVKRSRSRRPTAHTASASSALSSQTAPAVRQDAPLSKVRHWMAEHGLDALYITRPVSIAYLTGFHAEPHERLMALAVRSDRATLIVPAIEQEKASRYADTA